MLVLSGTRNFFGSTKSSLRNQPLILAGTGLGLSSSMASTCGRSVWVRTSLTSTGKEGGGSAGSSLAGEPKSRALGRQLSFKFHVRQSGLFSLTMTREAPGPSVIGYHLLS